MGEQFDLFGKQPGDNYRRERAEWEFRKTPQQMPGSSMTPLNAQAGAMKRPGGYPGNVSPQRQGVRPTTGSRANAAVATGFEQPTQYETMAPPPPPDTITDVTIDRNWFSPFQPVTPFGPPWINFPRSYDYPVGENINFLPGRIEVFSMLRTMAQGWGLLRAVIETRKDQLMRIPWIIRTKEQKERQKSGEQASRTAARAKDQKNPRIVMLNEFFKKPDKKLRFQQWARLLLEDLFVIDAPSIYIWRDKSGDPYACQVVDGATVKPLIDDAGRRPDFPNPAYQQVIKGLPLINLTEYELLYAPQRLRTQLPIYGYSPVEQIMLEICEGLRKQLYKNSFWNEGTLPEMLIGTPPDWRPEQIATFQQWFDSFMEGNLGQRSKARFIPGDMKPYDVKNADGGSLKTDEDEWLARIVCFAFSIAPTPFIRQLNRSTAQSAAQEAEEEGLHPLMAWFSDEIMNPLIQEDVGFGFDDLEFAWEPEPEVDEQKQMAVLTGYVKAGIQTVNEARDALNLPPDPAGDELIVETTMGPAPLAETLEANRAKANDAPNEIQRTQDNHEMGQQQGQQAIESGKQDLKDRKNAPPGKPVKKPAGKEVGKGSRRPFRSVTAPSMSRSAGAKAIATATTKISRRLKRMGGKAGAHVRAHKFAVAKKDDPQQQRGNRIDELLATFDLSDFADLADDLNLDDFVGDTVADAIAGLGYSDDDELFGIVNERAVKWAEENAADLVADIDDSTRDMLRSTISQALADNLDKDSIAAAIEDSAAFSDARAELIARTELGNANANASLIAYKTARDKTGLVIRKRWLLGPNPCVICQGNADEGLLDLDDVFSSGDDAPLAHPNCECDLSTEVEEESGEGDEEQNDSGSESDIEQIAKRKSTPVDANYVDQSPYSEHCAQCTMFRPSRNMLLGACTAVSGDINPGGWCRFFEAIDADGGDV